MNTQSLLSPATLESEIARVEHALTSQGYTKEVAGDDFDGVVACIASADLDNRCALLTGAPGCGKTMAMTLAHPEAHVLNMVCDSEVDEIMADVVAFATKHPLVILDDVGAEKTRNSYGILSEPFVTIMENWYAKGKPCRFLITTNITGQMMKERYKNDRLISRILSTCATFSMKGKDHRGKESCATKPTRPLSEDVARLLRDFRGMVRTLGKDSIYHKEFIRVESMCLDFQRDRDDLRDGVMEIMGGHSGCLVDDSNVPSIQETLAKLFAGKMKG